MAALATQNVVGTLSAAGFVAALRTRRVSRPGYGVRKPHRSLQNLRGAVLVFSDHAPAGETIQGYSERLEKALVDAGFQVSRECPDVSILVVRWA